MMRKTGSFETLSWVFDSRAQSLKILAEVQDGRDPIDALAGVVENLGRGSEALGDSDFGDRYRDYYVALGIVLFLVKWRHAIRTAQSDAARFLRAAQESAKDHVGDTKRSQRNGSHVDLARMVAELSDVGSVCQVAEALLRTPLPIPIFARPLEAQTPRLRTPPPPAPEGAVAVAEFHLASERFGDPQTIEPDKVYDLDATFRLSNWPSTAVEAVFEPLHVEPAGRVSAPAFTFSRPEGNAPFSLVGNGRLVFSVRQEIDARPLRITYGGRWEPASVGRLAVRGHRELEVMSFDPRLNPYTGYRLADERVLEIRKDIRRYGLVKDDHLRNFLVALAALCNLAGQSLDANLFPGKWSESRFQRRGAELLRGQPRIGSRLEEHPRAGGGITDLSFEGIRIELKVEPTGPVDMAAVERYFDQTKQYATGSDSRLALLCVLDCSPKSRAPDSLDNDIGLRPLSLRAGAKPTLLGVVIVRGNLGRPSDYSRSGSKTPPPMPI